MTRGPIRLTIAALIAASAALTACSNTASTSTSASGSASASTSSSDSAPTAVDAKTATSAADFGGLEGLVAAAKEEGALNVIALPHDWANYGKIIEAFEAKYGITVNEQSPDASSKEEIQAAEANKGTDKAPDVFDLGTNVTLESLAKFAPYQVEAWDDIPEGNKEATGLWVNDYTGVMVVGYNKTKYGEITSLDQLADPKFAGAVALNGKPAEAGSAFNGFLLANLASGGSMTDLQPGLDFFKKLNDAGTLNLTDVTPGTIAAGEHGVVFDWSYNHVAIANELATQGVEWATFVPNDIALGSYYNQAINVDAPHPAAARLWQEFLFSAEAQNLWAEGGALPVLAETIRANGEFSEEAEKAVPAVSDLKSPTSEEAEAANAFLTANWDKTFA